MGESELQHRLLPCEQLRSHLDIQQDVLETLLSYLEAGPSCWLHFAAYISHSELASGSTLHCPCEECRHSCHKLLMCAHASCLA